MKMYKIKPLPISLLITTLLINNLSAASINDNNTIHLIGESHSNQKCIEYRDQLINEAQNQEIILALEGEFNKEENVFGGNTFGIEEIYAYNLSFALILHLQVILHKIWSKTITLEVVDKHYHTNILKLTYNGLVNDPQADLSNIFILINRLGNLDNIKRMMTRNPEIMNWFISFYKLYHNQEEVNIAIKELTKNHSPEHPYFLNINSNISAWNRFAKDLLVFYCKRAIQENEDIAPTINQINTLLENVEEYANLEAQELIKTYIFTGSPYAHYQDVIDLLTIDERNKIFLKNTISIFENNKSQEKPFYIIVGREHIPFLYKQLKHNGYHVELNDMTHKYTAENLEDYRVEL